MQAFFQSLKDGPAEVSKAASGPSWRRPDWPQRPQNELVAALTGDWAEVEKAVGDKIKAKAQATGVELSAEHVQQAPRWYFTSPEPSTSLGVAEPPLNSWKITRCGLAITCASTLSRPRCAMPTTISFTPIAPPRLMICSSAGMIDSPPSSPKRLVPVNFRSQKFSKPSASISLLRIARRPSRVKLISLSWPFDALLDPGFLRRVGDVHELDAERLAVGAPQDRENLAQGRELEAEHLVEEDRAVHVGFAEAVGARIEVGLVVARLEPERIEIGVEMAARPIGADQHQRMNRIARRLLHVLGGKLDA